MSSDPVRDAAIETALDLIRRSGGYVVLREKSYRQAQERQRVAEALRAAEQDRREGTERWAREQCDEARRLRDRLTFVYGVAREHGATVRDLDGSDDPRNEIAQRLELAAHEARITTTTSTEDDRGNYWRSEGLREAARIARHERPQS